MTQNAAFIGGQVIYVNCPKSLLCCPGFDVSRTLFIGGQDWWVSPKGITTHPTNPPWGGVGDGYWVGRLSLSHHYPPLPN